VPAEVPVLDLVLLRVQILLVPIGRGLVFVQLVAAVDTVGRAHGGGQHQAQGEGRGRPVTKWARKGCRAVFGQEVGPHVIGGGTVGELLEVGPQPLLSVLLGPPREVGVALAEAGLGQACHHFGPGERLRQEQRLRDRPLALGAMTHSRKGSAWCADCPRGKIRTPREIQ